jgi:hypothetical protein
MIRKDYKNGQVRFFQGKAATSLSGAVTGNLGVTQRVISSGTLGR